MDPACHTPDQGCKSPRTVGYPPVVNKDGETFLKNSRDYPLTFPDRMTEDSDMNATDLHPAGSYYRETDDGSYEFVGPDGTVWGDSLTPAEVIALVTEDLA